MGWMMFEEGHLSTFKMFLLLYFFLIACMCFQPIQMTKTNYVEGYLKNICQIILKTSTFFKQKK